jgi:hypothetical protein
MFINNIVAHTDEGVASCISVTNAPASGNLGRCYDITIHKSVIGIVCKLSDGSAMHFLSKLLFVHDCREFTASTMRAELIDHLFNEIRCRPGLEISQAEHLVKTLSDPRLTWPKLNVLPPKI